MPDVSPILTYQSVKDLVANCSQRINAELQKQGEEGSAHIVVVDPQGSAPYSLVPILFEGDFGPVKNWKYNWGEVAQTKAQSEWEVGHQVHRETGDTESRFPKMLLTCFAGSCILEVSGVGRIIVTAAGAPDYLCAEVSSIVAHALKTALRKKIREQSGATSPRATSSQQVKVSA